MCKLEVRTKVINPYLDEFRSLDHRRWQTYLEREKLVTKYAWAVPNEEVLQEIAQYSPLIEIGAGTGYWSRLLEDRGADIVAFDTKPPTPLPDGTSNNRYCKPFTYFEVRLGGHEQVSKFPTRTLFLCWPVMDNMSSLALSTYQGKYVLYIGEGNGGCTGNDNFHMQLRHHWVETKYVPIPQWSGIYDRLYVYRRK